MILTNAIITAYCSCTLICCPKTSLGLTSSGKLPQANRTMAAGNRSIKLGSKVRWKGNVYLVEDRMHKRYDGQNRFDIYFKTHQAALNFGIKTNQTIEINSLK